MDSTEKVALIVKPFEVSVSGFPPYVYVAASRGKALAKAWGSYCSYRDDVSFGDFLKLARARRTPDPPRFGEAIVVCAEPAFRIGTYGQYVQFVRTGSEVILNSHPADVETVNG